MKTHEKLFAVLINSEIPIETKFVLFDRLNPDWFSVEKFTKLHSYISEALSANINPNLLTAVQWLRERKLITEKCSILNISDINAAFSWDTLTKWNMYCSILEQNYVMSQLMIVSRDLQSALTGDNVTIEKCQTVLSKGIELTQSKIVVDDSNSAILKNVIEIHDKVKAGEKFGLDLGFSSLRENVTLENVDMLVIGARPSMGKTAFAVSLLVKLAFQENKKVVFYALEMSKEQVMRRVISNLTGITAWKMKFGKLDTNDVEKMRQIENLPEWNNFEIIEGTNSANEIYYSISKRKNLGLVDVVIVDYLQKIKGELKQTKFESVTFASNRMKELSQNLKIPTICLAQLSRVSARAKERPTLPDLRDSGEIEQDASIIAFLHRPEYYGIIADEAGESLENKGEFIIAKNRDGDLGVYNFNICPETIKWSDTEKFKAKEVQPFSNLNDFANTNFDSTPF
jgi:replicative DNA helicase